MKFAALSIVAFLAASSSFAASPACSYKAGDKVTFTKPADYLPIAKSNKAALGDGKGEFETTADYEKRLKAASAALQIKSVVVEHPQESEDPFSYVKYDADTQKFKIFIGWIVGTLDGIDYRHMDKVVLSETLVSADKYIATNSYGAQAEVDRKVSDVIAIKSWNTFPKDIWWKLPRTADGDEGYSIYVPVPIERAKTFESRLVTGVEILPKSPYYSTDTYRIRPTMERTDDYTYRYEQFDGVVLCAVLADKDGTVVATVQPLIK
ncbi:hypothetical protein [Agrobacterium pusense]|uniref:hypothetical protein n=1 Tax=Agrobacterium pusense TaxID=648995 RepID=UPI0011B29E19|nr:hypothetical protein [Agrobacterium pusense]